MKAVFGQCKDLLTRAVFSTATTSSVPATFQDAAWKLEVPDVRSTPSLLKRGPTSASGTAMAVVRRHRFGHGALTFLAIADGRPVIARGETHGRRVDASDRAPCVLTLTPGSRR